MNLRKIANDFQELVLEGDFSEFYRVYCPTHEHINALSLLTPDVMATLIDENSDVADIVIADKKIWLTVTVNKMNIADKVSGLFRVYQRLMPEFQHKAKTFKG